MAEAEEPSLEELLWTVAAARLILGPDMSIQSPPNLSPDSIDALIAAGVNDWGGVSPVTPDFVNPEAPWPNLELLARLTANTRKVLAATLAVYPRYLAAEGWVEPKLRSMALRHIDADGLGRSESWRPGSGLPAPEPEPVRATGVPVSMLLDGVIERARAGR